jgi:hypothetical protein
MADGVEAECVEADFPPGAAPDLPNDSFGARVSATLRDAIKAAAYILCIILCIIGLAISYATKHAFQRMLAQALCVHQIHPLGFQNRSESGQAAPFAC